MVSTAPGTMQAVSTPQGLKHIYSPIESELARTEGLFEEVLATDNQFVLDMVRYLGQTLGKRVRTALVLLTYQACMKGAVDTNSEGAKHSRVTAEAVELIHVATLIHDDVIDDSPMRRGKKTLNYRWGNEITVLMGDFVGL